MTEDGPMKNHFPRPPLLLIVFFALVPLWPLTVRPATAQGDGIPEELFQAMTWREIGPYRGGRVTAVTGVPSRPHTFYMGTTGGGVWKSENAGHSWTHISDGSFNTSTIGAVAVALSDPNVIYVGTGESPIRGVTTSHGDGVYKSTDGGKTWAHLGLEKTRQISRIRVHPQDPDLVYVAAQGNPWGPNPERGVYRSENGGTSWEHVLEIDAETGAVDLSMDATNPRILYAATWEHRRLPWYIKSGGKGSGIHKSTDGGRTWTKLTDGLPELMGKIGVSVSPADPERVYAVIEAEEGGLYRSDDAGESWNLLDASRVLHTRAWYYNHVYADPVDADTVYVMNVPLLKSIDGGKSFETIRGPHGDHHDLWIHPDNNQWILNGNDGGATVSLDGAKTWSSLDNQPTAQFYRVITDNRFPYYIYGGQQDNTTVAIASQSAGPGIGRRDWYAVGGGESAHIAFDPNNPQLVYATSINGTLTEYDTRTDVGVPVRPYPEYVFGRDAKDHKYRTNWNAPIVASPHDPKVLYYGTQILLRSNDRGRTWEEISPDLTRDEEDKQGKNGGPITNEEAGAEFYNTIFYVVESPHEPGTIWVGSDDGLVHLSRDHGGRWANVTPTDAGEAHVNSIEVSPHDPAVVYIAVAGYKMNDFTPRIYKTADYGQRWTKIVDGLPADTFVRAVREDPDRPGLLYAGTETGVFVSFDDGGHWQSLQLDLPEVPVTDLTIRHQDLIAATQGRGFWVLDDLTPLHQLTPETGDSGVHLFKPNKAYLLGSVRSFTGPPPSSGTNPPAGAILHYYLGEERADDAEPIHLEIRDTAGRVVRTFSSAVRDEARCAVDNAEPRNRSEPKTLPTETGMNRQVWDLQREQLHCVEDVRLFSGWSGSRVIPGTYTARLTIDGEVREESFEVLADPRVEAASAEAWAELEAFLLEVTELFNEMMRSLDDLRLARRQISERLELLGGHAESAELAEAGQRVIDAATGWEEEVVQPRHKTFDDDINWPNMLDVQTSFLLSAADGAGVPLSLGARERLRDVKALWEGLAARRDAILSQDVAAFNERLEAADIPVVYVP